MKNIDIYLRHLCDLNKSELANSVNETANAIGEKYLRPFSFRSHEIGLLLGNVQSGKTAQMFGVVCKATDLGFPAFILLTTDNISLYQQTLDRVRFDLPQYCICGENDDMKFLQNNLVDPTIVVLKKNTRVLKKWVNVFGATSFMRGNPLFIIDDEADASSLNTNVNKSITRRSAINKHLTAIKEGASSSIYLQVTGTPQALYLQTQLSGWHPLFTYYFRPGADYLGGDFFFPQGDIPDCISIIDDNPNAELSVVIRHLSVSSVISSHGGIVSNCLIHPSYKQDKHKQMADKIRGILSWCRDNSDGMLRELLRDEFELIEPQKYKKCNFEKFYSRACDLLNLSAVRVHIMNGAYVTELNDYNEGFNIIIGGNTLGRGVTFPALNIVYYSRTSKAPQADTMWQHSRMFGYDRDPGLAKVFIESKLYKLFSDINATNNAIIAQVEQGIDNVQVFYPDGLKPTRGAVLDNKHVTAISGGTNYFPREPDNSSIDEIDSLLCSYSEKEAFYSVDLGFLIELLKHIVCEYSFYLQCFISCIRTLQAKQPDDCGVLVVRRHRYLSKGTGAMLSSEDQVLSNSFTNKAVLIMYKVSGINRNGGIEWGGRQIWIPNIKLPSNIVYYNIDDYVNDEDDDG